MVSNDFTLRNGSVLDLSSVRYVPLMSPGSEEEQRWNNYISDEWVISSRIRSFAESCELKFLLVS